MSRKCVHLFGFILIISLLLCNFAAASGIMPLADSEFTTTTLLLKSSKQVAFRATTYEVKDSISVTACWLEKENSDGTWSTVCSLPAPSAVATDNFSFATNADYSSYIGSGTYRIGATFNADGHTLSVTSNERTF